MPIYQILKSDYTWYTSFFLTTTRVTTQIIHFPDHDDNNRDGPPPPQKKKNTINEATHQKLLHDHKEIKKATNIQQFS